MELIKLSGHPVETEFSLDDFLLKVKASGAGDVKISARNFVKAVPTMGYLLSFGMGVSVNPADATTYFFGSGTSTQGGPSTSLSNTNRMYIPKDGNIRVATGTCISGISPGTSEQGALYIRVNNTTDYLITNTQQFNNTQNPFTNSSLDIPVEAGDWVVGKLITPTWVTNPTGLEIQMTMFVTV